MSFLPYGSGSPLGWLGAGGASAALNGAVIAGLIAYYSDALRPPEDLQDDISFIVTLEQLDAETLAGIVELQEQEAALAQPETPEALEPTEEFDTAALPDPETAEAEEPETIAPEQPEAAEAEEPETAETETPETAEAEEPEVAEAEQADTAEVQEPETVEAEAADEVIPLQPEAAEAQEVETAEAAEALPVETAEADTLEAALPESIETAEAPQPDTITGTEVAAVEESPILQPETVGPQPVVAQPAALDDPSLSPIIPDIASAAAVGTAAPSAPSLEAVQPLAPEAQPVAIGPAAPAEDIIGQSQTIEVAQPPPAALDAVEADTALVVEPTRPGGVQTITPVDPRAPVPPRISGPTPPPVRQPSPQDLALSELIRNVRSQPTQPCLVAMPRRDGTEDVGLAFVGAQDGAMDGFASALQEITGVGVSQSRTLVDPRQCPALTFVQDNREYPATRMGLRVDQSEIQSGGRLTGLLRGSAGRYVTLLLIDDNGVVQNLQRFMSFSGNLARFDVPVTRNGPARDTKQILLALATQRPPGDIRARDGQLAQDVFTGLSRDLREASFLAFATFDVR